MVFLDASTVIYLLEGEDALQRSTRSILGSLRTEVGAGQLAVSALSLLECRVQPVRHSDQARVKLFDRFFGHPGLSIIEIDRNVIEIATGLRAELRLRTPDAIQAASALRAAPDVEFVTGDSDFPKVPNLRVHLVQNS